MPVHSSPATNLVNFKIESVQLSGNVSRMEILATGGHQLTGAGLIAVLGTLNTYYGTTITAANVDTIILHAGTMIGRVSQFRVSANVRSADLVSLNALLVANLQSAGAVKVG